MTPAQKAAIGRLLEEAMDQAARNGANSVSMPDHYVEVAAWLAAEPEWDALRDPTTLHANLLRGLPAQLSREQFLHLAGEPQSEPVAQFKRADNGNYPVLIWRQGYEARIGDKFYAHPARTPLTEADVFILVGVAHGPYLDGLTELPMALLDVAQKISATLGDIAMVQRCKEMSARLTSERAHGITGEQK